MGFPLTAIRGFLKTYFIFLLVSVGTARKAPGTRNITDVLRSESKSTPPSYCHDFMIKI